jgi:hypothetical protein
LALRLRPAVLLSFAPFLYKRKGEVKEKKFTKCGKAVILRVKAMNGTGFSVFSG